MKTTNYKAILILAMLFLLTLPLSAAGSVKGKIIDFSTKKPIEGAIITGDSEIVRTDNNGMFMINKPTDKIGIRAYGYARGEMPVCLDAQPDVC